MADAAAHRLNVGNGGTIMQTAASEAKLAVPVEGGMSTSHFAKWRTTAALVIILPAAGAAFGARSVMNAFRDMSLAGRGGIGAVAPAIYEAHPLLIATALAAALIAGAMAVALARKPYRAAEFPGLRFSFLVLVLACAPALLLWIAESYPLDFLAGRITGSNIAEAARHLENLLMGTMGLAITAIGIAVIVWRLSLKVSRTGHEVRPSRLVTVWAGAAILLVCLAAAFTMRSSYLMDAALRGSL